ncbi:MAG: multi-sensor signal transduction histidine kinase [Firmicutes bacterium]|nr:multi-sensor signal transduction histidine kinase [Bacillota bacterium]
MAKFGLRNRLMVSYLGLVVLTLLVLGAYILHFFYQHTLTSLTANLLTQADITQKLLAENYYPATPQANIDDTIKNITTNTDIRITVIAPDGSVVADSWENPVFMENHAERAEIIQALSGGQGTSIRFSTTLNEDLLYVAVPIQKGTEIVGVLRLSTTLAHINRGFDNIRTVLIAAFFLASLLAVLISNRLTKKYTAPLEKITAAAHEISEGDLSKRVHVQTRDEIEVLARTLNNLAANLDEKMNEITAEKMKLELILRNTNSAIILLDRYGHVIDYNPAAMSAFNITQNMLGRHNIQVIGNGLFDTAVHETVITQDKQTLDLKIEFNGNKRAFLVSLAPIVGSETDASSVLAVFHDITTLRELQEKQANFIANASHELGTPLTAIIGFAETLLDGAISDPDLGLKFTKIIHAEAQRMHRLVKDLLQIAKLEAHDYRASVETHPTAIEPLVNQVINDLTLQWQQKKITLTTSVPLEPVAVMANTDWLKQVLLNLVDNAIKYTPLDGNILLKWWQEDDEAVFIIQDSGVGIPAQDLPHIFDRFYRVERSRTRSAGGTGLGLAIVKFIVEMFGGSIEAKSDFGLGTSFIFRLPTAPYDNKLG